MRPGNGAHPGLVLVLVMAVGLVVGMLGGSRSLWKGEAVPAVSVEGGPGTGSSEEWVEKTDPGVVLLRIILNSAIPGFGLSSKAPALSWWLRKGSIGYPLLVFLVGVNPFDPRSFLSEALPMLHLAPRAELQDMVRYETPLHGAGAGESTGARDEPGGSKEEGPLVLIYHTHSRESYLPELKLPGQPVPEAAFSDDLSVNVVRVGEELALELQKLGIGSVQSRKAHDKKGRIGSYERSLVTVEALLARFPSIKALADIHRDAARREETTVEIDGQTVARVMVVLGTDQRLPHPRYDENYRFGLKVLEIMERNYPGLSRGIYPKADRYNQHVSPTALLYEIGGVDNSLEEALRSARLLARVLAEVLKSERS